MFSESPTQRHFRELAKYKLYLELTHKYLVIKLYKKQTDSNYYSACLLFSQLPLIYTVVFSSLQQIYNELIHMGESQFTFDQNTCEFKYMLKMAIKTLQMPFRLKVTPVQKQDELEMQNYQLKESHKEYETIIAEKQKQLQDYKLQIQKYKQKTGQIDHLLDKLQLQTVKQLEALLTQLLKQAEKLLQSNQLKNSSTISTEISSPSLDQQPNNNVGKRNKKLWDPPARKFFINNQGNLQQKLLIKQKEKFSFYPSEQGKYSKKFSFGDYCRLKLVETHTNPFNFYTVLASDPINMVGRTVLNIRNIKKFPHAKGVVVGLKCYNDQSASEDRIDFSSIYYNLKTGNLTTNIGGRETVVYLMEIKENQTLHLSVNVQTRAFQCYCNQMLLKEFLLDEAYFESTLIPFVKMSVAGEQIEFL